MKPLLPWQQAQWRQLCGYIRQQRIPQALLITGNKGLGKRELAEHFTATLLCHAPNADNEACGHCHGCKLHAAGNHPDLFVVSPDEPGKAIGINTIRELIVDTQLKPQYDTYRIVIIDPADQLNRPAANAFLKCLEEPTERTVILLITAKPAKLPITIASRCQRLAVNPPDSATVVAWLKAQSIADAEALATLARNAPFAALHYANEQALAVQGDCFKAWLDIAKHRASPIVIAEDWQKLPLPSLLSWLTSWLIDLIKCKFRSEGNLLQESRLRSPLQELSGQLDLKKLYQLYDLLLAARERLDSQINKQMMLEEILIQWSELNRS
ncbi:DNA polymerase III subunit delta' [Methylomicrobium sp. Wu6]|uniref:DNA polymerase III subunit delta' n=1 Tax=Methylomicrobium sp. Wu6 TaxID=3107928 RepID=UPI002DD6A1F3|nr:DNA polymerase III subunit delta' [Methylomicrobium sp. Wu6]MEC4747816.1 DNA polymerase III subunit delta' [Methylomicrobium sp. Wu6]